MSVAHIIYSQRKDDLKNNGCDSHSISPLFRMHEEKKYRFLRVIFCVLVLIPTESVKRWLRKKTSTEQVFEMS